jgi:hypothetical protein
VLYFTLVLLALLTALAVHELGHLVAGLLGGFRFQLFVVGLLGVKRTPAGIRVFLNRDVGLMGGVAATVPVAQDPVNKRKFAWMLLSGPLASLLSIITRQAMDGNAKNIPLDQARLLQTDAYATMRFWGSYFAYAYFRENGLTAEAERARADLAAFEKVVPKPLSQRLKLNEGTAVPPEPGLQARE